MAYATAVPNTSSARPENPVTQITAVSTPSYGGFTRRKTSTACTRYRLHAAARTSREVRGLSTVRRNGTGMRSVASIILLFGRSEL